MSETYYNIGSNDRQPKFNLWFALAVFLFVIWLLSCSPPQYIHTTDTITKRVAVPVIDSILVPLVFVDTVIMWDSIPFEVPVEVVSESNEIEMRLLRTERDQLLARCLRRRDTIITIDTIWQTETIITEGETKIITKKDRSGWIAFLITLVTFGAFAFLRPRGFR